MSVAMAMSDNACGGAAACRATPTRQHSARFRAGGREATPRFLRHCHGDQAARPRRSASGCPLGAPGQYRSPFGLIAATGLLRCEALALDIGDATRKG